MPSHFGRFRLLNDKEGGVRRFRNESLDQTVHARAEEGDEPIVIHPGEEWLLPESVTGETILDIVEG